MTPSTSTGRNVDPKNMMPTSSSATESNEEITTLSQLEVNEEMEAEEDTTIKNDECSNCLCNCKGDGTASERSTTAKTISPTTSDGFVDLFDLYNQTDLKNGVFDEGKQWRI